jgi:NTP pyrophosphatase (non-canonical NTP hydrolase)
VDLAKLVEIQTAFSREKFPTFWDIKTEQDLALRLEYLTNALAGEVGEVANLVKKVVRSVVYGRGDLRLDDVRQELAEEIADVFTYLLTIAGLLGLDLEKTYLQKLEKNRIKILTGAPLTGGHTAVSEGRSCQTSQTVDLNTLRRSLTLTTKGRKPRPTPLLPSAPSRASLYCLHRAQPRQRALRQSHKVCLQLLQVCRQLRSRRTDAAHKPVCNAPQSVEDRRGAGFLGD